MISMTLHAHVKNNFWPYVAIASVIGVATVQSGKWHSNDNYAADAYDMNLHVWLCGRCHHVFDEKEEAEECCTEKITDIKIGDVRGDRDFWAELFTDTDAIKVTINGLDGFYATDGEVILGYTTASEEGFEEKKMKPVIWVWDEIEGYGTYLDTKDISFASESFKVEDFASAMIVTEPKMSAVEKALLTNYMIRKVMFNDTLSYLKQELKSGRITPKKYALSLLDLEQQLRSEQNIMGTADCPCGCEGKTQLHDANFANPNNMKSIVIKPNRVKKINVDWDSTTKPLIHDPFNEVEWSAEGIEMEGRQRVGGRIVEDCVDIRSSKVDETSRYYRIRFRDPKAFSNFRVPAWAARAANSIGHRYFDVIGSKITMGQTLDGDWSVQSVLIPKISRLTPAGALKVANHIQDRIEREGFWASKDCKDNERIIVVS